MLPVVLAILIVLAGINQVHSKHTSSATINRVNSDSHSVISYDCNDNQYANMLTKECEACHVVCHGCRGPGPNNCLSCKNIPVFNGNETDPHCSSEESESKSPSILFIFLMSLLLSLLGCAAFILVVMKCFDSQLESVMFNIFYGFVVIKNLRENKRTQTSKVCGENRLAEI